MTVYLHRSPFRTALMLALAVSANPAYAVEDKPPQAVEDGDIATVTLRGGHEATIVFDRSARQYRLCSEPATSSTKHIVIKFGGSRTMIPPGECVDFETEGVRVVAPEQNDVARIK